MLIVSEYCIAYSGFQWCEVHLSKPNPPTSSSSHKSSGRSGSLGGKGEPDFLLPSPGRGGVGGEVSLYCTELQTAVMIDYRRIETPPETQLHKFP